MIKNIRHMRRVLDHSADQRGQKKYFDVESSKLAKMTSDIFTNTHPYCTAPPTPWAPTKSWIFTIWCGSWCNFVKIITKVTQSNTVLTKLIVPDINVLLIRMLHLAMFPKRCTVVQNVTKWWKNHFHSFFPVLPPDLVIVPRHSECHVDINYILRCPRFYQQSHFFDQFLLPHFWAEKTTAWTSSSPIQIIPNNVLCFV